MAIFFLKHVTFSFIALICLLTSCGAVPKNCYIMEASYVFCYPHIPSFLHIYEWDLTGVKTFRLYSSSSFEWTLQTLPDDIFEMASDIKYLFLKNAGIKKMPCDVFKPFQKSLEQIDLSNNLFEEFPICALKQFEALKIIKLENQQLKYFQADMISWNSIHTISLMNNELRIFNISNIDNQNEVSIFLDNNKISILEMFNTSHIGYLSAKNNLIRNLNANIFQTSKTTLKYLDVSWNRLDNSIWDALAEVSSLQTLKLKNNHISFTSSFILNSASNLEYLDLSNNQLTSLAGVALRSGKLRYLFLGSNKLTEVPPFLTSSTNTFDSFPQQYDLSNNLIEKIYISIPSSATSLTVRLDRNNLREITFDSKKTEIGTFDISYNDMSFIPNLPKANTYVLSYNPLNTTDVIQKLTNEMLGASVIELENVGLFCGDDDPRLPTLNTSGLSSLNLKHNCVPLDIICHMKMSCIRLMSLYLDKNRATRLNCSLRDKCFNVLSVNECGLNNTVMNHIFSEGKITFFSIISAQQNDATHLPLIQKIPIQTRDFSCDLSMNRIKMFKGFNISAYTVNLDLKNNEISSIKESKMWSSSSHIYLTLSFAYNSLVEVTDRVVSIHSLNDNLYYTLISIDVSYNLIREIKFRNFIQFQTKRNITSPYLNINLSHNNIQFIEDCLQPAMYLTLNLTFNNITTLPNMSCGMAYKMYLGYNEIPGIFTPIPTARTQILDLQWNRITEIHLNAFDNLTQLTQLNLRGNMIDSFPSSIKTLRLLDILDISFNRIRHISQSHFNDLKGLQKLIITENNIFIPASDLQLSKLYHNEENEIHCDCDMLFLRNQSFSPQFKVTGRCTSPPEYEGYHVSCFPASQCTGFVPLYITKTTIQTCRKDKFSDITMNTEEIENMLLIHIKIIGQQNPRSISMKAYKNKELVQQVQLNITDRSKTFWLDRNLGLNRLCFLPVLFDNETILRCFAVNVRSKYRSDKTDENNGILYGISSLLAISLFMNICIGLFTLITYRNKHKKADKQYSKDDINTESYEIPSATNVDSPSQPVYEDIPDIDGNNREYSYSNLALDI